MKMTIYKVHGLAYNYVAAVDEESKTVYFMDEKSFTEPGVLEDNSIKFEDIGIEYIQDECLVTEWEAFTLEEWAKDKGCEADDEAWEALVEDVVFGNDTSNVLAVWNDIEVM